MSRFKQSLRKSLFNRYFAICSVVTLATIAIMGGLVIGFSARYFSETTRESLRKNAEQAAAITVSGMADYGYQKVPVSTVQNGYRIISSTTETKIFVRKQKITNRAAEISGDNVQRKRQSRALENACVCTELRTKPVEMSNFCR